MEKKDKNLIAGIMKAARVTPGIYIDKILLQQKSESPLVKITFFETFPGSINARASIMVEPHILESLSELLTDSIKEIKQSLAEQRSEDTHI